MNNLATSSGSALANDNLPSRPLTVLVAALGGEGGGVLADWIIAAATARDYPVQSTSIPGVSQRTGATTYYVELYPATRATLGGRRPVMTLTPSPGWVDVMIASELLEAGRAMQNGYVSPERTTLIASTHRIYTVLEKMHMADGRYDSQRVLDAAQQLARQRVLFDMQSEASDAGTVISAVLFGALAGSAALPLSRADCEDTIRASGKGVQASLRGFAAGYAQAVRAISAAEAVPTAAAAAVSAAVSTTAPAFANHASLPPSLQASLSALPAAAQPMLREGVARCLDFQDIAYAELYLSRMQTIARLDADPAAQLSSETARFLALWMCYEDVIRVADLKTRLSRHARVRAEVQARPGEALRITEFLKPGLDEVAALLPPALSGRLRQWAHRRGLTDRLNKGLYLQTTSLHGFLLLRLLAWLRPLRRKTSRWQEEQALIERWLRSVAEAGKEEPSLALALELALCGRLIKGYGDTHRRGKDNFLRILDTLANSSALQPAARAIAIRQARLAALADPEGRALEGTLASHGITPLPPKAKPLNFVRKAAG